MCGSVHSASRCALVTAPRVAWHCRNCPPSLVLHPAPPHPAPDPVPRSAGRDQLQKGHHAAAGLTGPRRPGGDGLPHHPAHDHGARRHHGALAAVGVEPGRRRRAAAAHGLHGRANCGGWVGGRAVVGATRRGGGGCSASAASGSGSCHPSPPVLREVPRPTHAHTRTPHIPTDPRPLPPTPPPHAPLSPVPCCLLPAAAAAGARAEQPRGRPGLTGAWARRRRRGCAGRHPVGAAARGGRGGVGL